MQEIIIDEQFAALLPALDGQTYALLEESLLSNGCLHPLVLWNNVLIDGHNRYEICRKHEIPFSTIEKEFGSRDEALIWIISTQVARRNLTPIQLSYFRGVHYNADKRVQGTANRYSEQMKKGHNDGIPQPQSTAVRLAGEYNVSPKTIKRDAQLSLAIDAIGDASPKAKREILSGAADISRKYLRELGAESEETIAETAAGIADGTFERGKATSKSDAADVMEAFGAAIAKMADEFSAAIERLKNEVDAGELKAALRGHIDALKAMQSRI